MKQSLRSDASALVVPIWCLRLGGVSDMVRLRLGGSDLVRLRFGVPIWWFRFGGHALVFRFGGSDLVSADLVLPIW